jgi:hypothetical protein
MLTLSHPVTKAVALAVLLGTTALASTTFAGSPGNMAPNTAVNEATMTTPAPVASTAAPMMMHQGPMHAAMSPADMDAKMKHHVEVRIKTLHDELKVTADQDAAWETVAQAMRDNEESMSKLVDTRHTNVGTMTAVDDIKSYQEIAQNHADSLAKFVAAFEPFYNSLTADQKKTADEFFSKSQMHEHKHMHKHGASKTAPAAPATK